MNVTDFNNLTINIRKFDVENEIVWFYAIESNGAIVVPVATNMLETEFFDLRTEKLYSDTGIFNKLKEDYFLKTSFCRVSTKELQKSLAYVCGEGSKHKELFDLISKKFGEDKKTAFPVLDDNNKKINRSKLIKKADAIENILTAVDNYQQEKDLDSYIEKNQLSL